MKRQTVNEWFNLMKQYQNGYRLSESDWIELKRLNHLVMEKCHEIHNNSQIDMEVKMTNYITNCKRIETAIRRAKNYLIEKAQNGIYENFGQDEVRIIEDKFINSSKFTDEENEKRRKLESFDNWCMNYNG